MSQLSTATNVLTRLLDPVGRIMPLDFARALADLKAMPDVQAHLDELAEKSNEGTLTGEERKEYEAFIDAIDIISILQGKAREVIARHPGG